MKVLGMERESTSRFQQLLQHFNNKGEDMYSGRHAVKMGVAFVLALALIGCLGSGGGGGTNNSNPSGTGPVGYATCITSNWCNSYIGSGYNGATAASTACIGTGMTFVGTSSGCSLANSIGTCTINWNGGANTVATTRYTGGTPAEAQASCLAAGGTYGYP